MELKLTTAFCMSAVLCVLLVFLHDAVVSVVEYYVIEFIELFIDFI